MAITPNAPLSSAQRRAIDEAIMDAKLGALDLEDVYLAIAKVIPNASDEAIEALVKSRWNR